MMNSDFELGDSTNPRLESELESSPDSSTSEKRLDSESLNLIAPSDVAIDSGNVSDVNNRRVEDSKNLGVFEFHEKEVVVSDRNHASVKKLKTEKKTKKKNKKGQVRIDLKSKESTSPVYDSMISMFDDYAENGSVGSGEDRSSREVSPDHGFEVGDMVWAKVKSHPWWPGHVYSEQFATPSVRRSKREGLLLVAFFGDSSYGWFDPSELVPFDSYFAEKHRQTNSKTFVKAVEEATDEVSRRSALGLSCMCRSKDNFRQTDVEGYFAVDVADYEPGAVYSIDAIVKARDCFQPSSALDFVRQLALEPSVREYAGIDFIKNKANLISYRRAVYEEFDETYAQAFGYDPVRPLPGSHQEAPLRKAASKAPLSGRQVFSDTSGKGKSGTKPNKSKDNVKKDKYLFKRRDEPKEVIKVHQKEKGKVTSSPQIEDDVAIPAGDHVLQKRDSTTHEQFGITNANDDLPSRDASMEDTPIVGDPDDDDDDKRIVSQMDDKSSTGKNVVTQTGIPHSKPPKKVASQKVDNGPQKVKVTKSPIEELGLIEKKKKRKKEELGVPLVEKEKVSAKKPHQLAALAPNHPPIEEDPHGSDNNKPTTSHTSGAQDVSNYETELLRVLGDLHSLALDPFNTTGSINKGRIVKTRKALLKFRSLVFQKSLNLSAPAAEDERNDSQSCEKPKQGNSSGRPDDPTKGGRKRGPSDRQEEIAAKEKKKVGDIRTLTKEKKVIKKIDEQPPSARDVKQQPAAAMTLKKSGPQLVRKTEPTMLNIKFQQGGNLPSLNELKATFVRYGAMDLSATRIFWNTCTCRVVYRATANALSAYRFVVGSSSLFGNTDVKCTLKEVGGDSEQPLVKDHHNHQPVMEDRPLKSILKKSGGEEAAVGNNGGKGRVKFMLGGDETQMENKNKNGASSFSSTTTYATMDFNSKNFQMAVLQSSNPLPPLLPLPLPLPNSSAVTSSSSSSSSNSSSSSSSSSNTQFTRPPPPPNSMHYGMTPLAPPALLPPPPGKFVHNLQRPNIGPPLTPKADISQQMLSLMTKCNEVVTDVTNIFGYVPYHPL